jgi:hypothetical protein
MPANPLRLALLRRLTCRLPLGHTDGLTEPLFVGVDRKCPGRAQNGASDPTWTSLSDTGERWTKLPMISTWDDICWIWSKRASSTSIVASLYRLVVVPFHLVQQLDRNVA